MNEPAPMKDLQSDKESRQKERELTAQQEVYSPETTPQTLGKPSDNKSAGSLSVG